MFPLRDTTTSEDARVITLSGGFAMQNRGGELPFPPLIANALFRACTLGPQPSGMSRSVDSCHETNNKSHICSLTANGDQAPCGGRNLPITSGFPESTTWVKLPTHEGLTPQFTLTTMNLSSYSQSDTHRYVFSPVTPGRPTTATASFGFPFRHSDIDTYSGATRLWRDAITREFRSR